jgi:hypothetical protein
VALGWPYKTLKGNVFLLVNGINMQSKLTLQILAIFHMEILPLKKQKIKSPQILTFYAEAVTFLIETEDGKIICASTCMIPAPQKIKMLGIVPK